MIETKEQYQKVLAHIALFPDDMGEATAGLIEALREVLRAAHDASHSDVVDWGLQLKLLGRKVHACPDWLREE